MKLLRAFFLLPLSALALALPRVALAQTEPEPESDEAPGASATPPEAPAEVPPPSSSTVTHPGEKGTTSSGVYVQGDEHVHRQPGGSGLVYRRGRYMLRDAEGIFELSPGALLQTDWYGFAGLGVPDYQRADGTGLKSNFSLRRMRLELTGRVLQRWYFVISGESANGNGFQPLNDYVGVEASRMLRVQVGQMRIPFMMDNVTSIRWSDFMERSLSTRVLGAPLTRDIGAMVWGGTERSAVWYALGYFGGEGQNRASTDNRGDVVGRLVLRPLWGAPGSIKTMHIGVSGRWGRRDPNYVQYDAPSMSTPGGYTFW
ncbi:MAG: porin, partial [Polyangiales bacterium]